MKEFKCPICNEPKKGCCRCPSFVKHDMESLKKGHGMTCKNGHFFNSNGQAYDPETDTFTDLNMKMKVLKRDGSPIEESTQKKISRFDMLYEKLMNDYKLDKIL